MGGTQRLAKWCKYLTRNGWRVAVITVKSIAYHAYDESMLDELQGVRVIRTGSLDPARVLHLLKGSSAPPPNAAGNGRLSRLLQWLFFPDLRVLWLPFVLWRGWREIKRNNVGIIVTSGPPHSTHLLGMLLARRLRVKWVSDFRDGWSYGDFLYAPTRSHQRLHKRLEAAVARRADLVLSVSRGLTEHLRAVGERSDNTTHFLPNGYDREDFAASEHEPNERFEITHVGALSEIADPTSLFQGFRALVDASQLAPQQIHLNFVGRDLTGRLAPLIAQYHLQDFVECSGYLPHQQAVAHLQRAELLVFIVGSKAHPHHIPGKTFEYLAARKPILLIGQNVEGMQLLQERRQCRHCHFDDSVDIASALHEYFAEWRAGRQSQRYEEPVDFSRARQAARLSEWLEELLVERS